MHQTSPTGAPRGGVPSPQAGAPELVASRLAYRNPWMTVREDALRRPDGSTAVYGVVDKADFALAVPVARGGFHIVEQYRYPVGGRFWEFPQGSWPAGHTGAAADDAAALARAELREETGLIAGSLIWLGRLHVAHGYSSQRCHVFLAHDLTRQPPEREASEADMVERWVSAETLDTMIAAGQFVDGTSLAALALLERSSPPPLR